MGPKIAPEAGNCYGLGLRAKIQEFGLKTVTDARVVRIEDGAVVYEKGGKEERCVR